VNSWFYLVLNRRIQPVLTQSVINAAIVKTNVSYLEKVIGNVSIVSKIVRTVSFGPFVIIKTVTIS
jgi:hypothetical protein